MDYLIVSGCSFTSSRWRDLPDKTHIIAWPDYLRDKFFPNAKLLNFADNGVGNDYIFYSLIHGLKTIEPGSKIMCIAAWTNNCRESWLTEDRSIGLRSNYDTRLSSSLWIHDNYTHDRRKGKVPYYVKNQKFNAQRVNLYRYALGKFCDDLNVTLHDFNMLEAEYPLGIDCPYELLINPKQSLFEKIIFDFIPELENEELLCSDNFHPNAAGQKLIAERVYNELQRLGY